MVNKMKKNDDSLDKLFESARNYKSPISQEDVRSLLGKRDLFEHKPKSFFSKKGVKIMSIISALSVCLIVASLSLNLFDRETHGDTKQADNTSQNSNAAKTIEEHTTAIIANKTDSKKQVLNTNNNDIAHATKSSGMKVQGLNRIILTEDELLKIGIYLGEDRFLRSDTLVITSAI
jgi:hypothetical protein